MKSNLHLSLLFLLICLNCFSQKEADYEYTGIEYTQLKSELIRGWNTWNTKSVLSHVLLPEAISVDFYLKDKVSGKVLKEALMGKRGKAAEIILPRAHSYNGSYTDLSISCTIHGSKSRSTDRPICRQIDISICRYLDIPT